MPTEPAAPFAAAVAPAPAAAPDAAPLPAAAPTQPRNPLHGLTLQHILETLVQAYGWPGLAERIALRCFSQQPSVSSSLKVLRKTPWAREKVESLYLYLLREQRRSEREGRATPPGER
jgi:uncharacterized protein (DUF2132 family)